MEERIRVRSPDPAPRLPAPPASRQLTKGELETISAILRLVLSDDALDKLLGRALELILAAPVFREPPAGCIYLAGPGEKNMRLAAFQGVPAEQRAVRERTHPGYCRPHADGPAVVHINRLQQLHDPHTGQTAIHAHHRAVIENDIGVIGILNVCLAEGHGRSRREGRFVALVADVLADLISRKRTEAAQRLARADAERRLERVEAQLRDSTRIISRAALEEHVISVLLDLSARPLDMEEYLKDVMQALLSSVPWLSALPRGAIFLAARNEEREVLRLMASHGFSEDMERRCSVVSFGHCLCGRAAAERQVHYNASAVDTQHEMRAAGMPPHGYYAVPILLGDSVLGVLVLYLPQDYTRQDSDESFLRRVADVLSMGITRRRAESRIEYLKDYDTLTGLPNRNLLLSHLRAATAQSERNAHVGAVLCISLDHFKQINNSLGRRAGDALLRELADRVSKLIRKGDVLARIGGDEFALVLSGEAGGTDGASRRAQAASEKLRLAVCAPFSIEGHDLSITPSIGISLFPANGATAGEVLQQADTAMHRAKAEGRNSVRFFLPAMQRLVDKRFAIERDLRFALEKDRLELYFQPQLDAQANLIGAEALLRCTDAQGNFVRTDQCIEVAEATDLILQLGEWVLCEACSMLETWRREGVGASLGHLCVNISPKQFYQANFVPLVKSILAEYAVDPRQLVFEVTESMLLNSKEEAIQTMQALKALGIGLAVDDFGTGYSSLSYLTRLPLDILKIDREFVTGVVHDRRQATVVETLIVMSRQLGFDVIAEGVETGEELAFLVDKRCTAFQGYYFSRPKSAQEFGDLLRHLAN